MGNLEIDQILTAVEENFCCRFKNRGLLHQALTHTSFANESVDKDFHNELLEFLGDSVLGLIVTQYLYENNRHGLREGDLSKMKALMVNEQSLFDYSLSKKLGEFLFLGKGEEGSGGRVKPSILSAVFEAIIGAYYLDRGLAETKKFLLPFMEERLGQITSLKHTKDYKTLLKEKMQQMAKPAPIYKLLKKEGPEHRPVFTTVVFLEDKEAGIGKGKNKLESQLKAAEEAFLRLP